MKFKEVLLDFTPLLDVIMIILFWFILNYHNQTVEVQNQAKEMMAEAKSISEEAEGKMLEAENIKQQVEDELNTLREEQNNSASHVQALQEFGKSENINIFLEISDDRDHFILNVEKGKNTITVIKEIIPEQKLKNGDRNPDFEKEKEQLQKKICDELEKALLQDGITNDQTILCTFLYNSNTDGTNVPCTIVDKILSNDLKRRFKNLYVSSIDTIERSNTND